MRLFVAIDIDRAVAAAAAALIEALRSRANRLAPHARITWIPEDRLHLTVRFIGNVDNDQARAIQSVLDPALSIAPFDLALAGGGAFPKAGAPRVLWAGVRRGVESLQLVEREVMRRLETIGLPADDRPYRPHLTLARIREAAGLHASALFDGIGEPVLGTTPVEAITLYESRLSPKGPTYVALHRTRLGSG